MRLRHGSYSDNDILNDRDDEAYEPGAEGLSIQPADHRPAKRFRGQALANLRELDAYIKGNKPSIEKICGSYLSFLEADAAAEKIRLLLVISHEIADIERIAALNLPLQEPDDIISFLAGSHAPPNVKLAILRYYDRSNPSAPDSSEFQSFHGWFRWISRLPVHRGSTDGGKPPPPAALGVAAYLTQARATLDRKLHGLQDAKTHILGILRARRLRQAAQQPLLHHAQRATILGLNGPVGVGKTLLASLIAECDGRELQRVIISDKASLEGSDQVWKGSQPGMPVRALCAGGADCVILIDEIDKVRAEDSDLLGALLWLLDPQENGAFLDNFVGHFPVSFADVFFIVTANDTGRLHPALLDRVDWVRIAPPSRDDMRGIVRDHVLPAVLVATNTPNLRLDEDALEALLGRGHSTRGLQYILHSICRDIGRRNDLGPAPSVDRITVADVRRFDGNAGASVAAHAHAPPGMYS